MIDIQELKYEFIFNEIFQASIYASFSTRNPKYPIYAKDIKKPKTLTSDLKGLVETYILKFKKGDIDENDHFEEIVNISKSISNKYKDVLHESRFRIGIAQKLLNLTLKYLWCMEMIKKPIHCPIDSIVIEKLNPRISNTYWTKLDCIEEYRNYISEINTLAKSQNTSIAEWELNIWNRRSI